MEVGEWCYNTEHRQVCRVIEAETSWGETVCRVCLPEQDAVVRIRADQFRPLDEAPASLNSHHICYVAAAAKVADALTQGEPLDEARDNLLDAVRMMQEPGPHEWEPSFKIRREPT